LKFLKLRIAALTGLTVGSVGTLVSQLYGLCSDFEGPPTCASFPGSLAAAGPVASISLIVVSLVALAYSFLKKAPSARGAAAPKDINPGADSAGPT
jgi:hypothetical protein